MPDECWLTRSRVLCDHCVQVLLAFECVAYSSSNEYYKETQLTRTKLSALCAAIEYCTWLFAIRTQFGPKMVRKRERESQVSGTSWNGNAEDSGDDRAAALLSYRVIAAFVYNLNSGITFYDNAVRSYLRICVTSIASSLIRLRVRSALLPARPCLISLCSLLGTRGIHELSSGGSPRALCDTAVQSAYDVGSPQVFDHFLELYSNSRK